MNEHLIDGRKAKAWERTANKFSEMAMNFDYEINLLSGINDRLKHTIDGLISMVSERDAKIAEFEANSKTEETKDGYIYAEECFAEMEKTIAALKSEITELRKVAQAEWTTETPTEEGWYWIAYNDDSCRVVKLYINHEICWVVQDRKINYHLNAFLNMYSHLRWIRITPPETE